MRQRSPEQIRTALQQVDVEIAKAKAAASTRRTQGWNPSSDGINALVSGGGDAFPLARHGPQERLGQQRD